jgi:hypothetical protein
MKAITRRSVLTASATIGAAGGLSTLTWAAGGGAPAINAAARAGHVTLAQSERRMTTSDNPSIIPGPKLALANLSGSAGKALVEQDRAALNSVFGNNIEVAERTVPKCNVLFLYCALETSGRVTGLSVSFRDVIKGAGAHIAVIASEVDPGLLSNAEFGKSLSARSDWPANIVITLSRNGAHFGRFFRELFTHMQAGVSMPMAWVRLAPQGPQQPNDIPGTIALMEAGHIAFGPRKS